MLMCKQVIKNLKKSDPESSMETITFHVLSTLAHIEKDYIRLRETTQDSIETIWYNLKDEYGLELNLDEIETWYKKVYKQYLKITKRDSKIIL